MGDVVRLASYPDDYFDLAFDAGCLVMILGKDREACVANVWRVLKPGGIFYAESHLLHEAIRQRLALGGQDYFDPEGRYSTAQGLPMYHFSREEEFIALIEGAGFELLHRQKEPPHPSLADLPFCAGGMWVTAIKPRRGETRPCHIATEPHPSQASKPGGKGRGKTTFNS